MEIYFIDKSVISNLTEAAKYIETDPHREAQDLPILIPPVIELLSAVLSRTALTASGQTQQASADKQESDGFLTVEEAAEMLQLSKSHLYLLIRQGKFPAIHTGERQYRIRKSEILNWKWEDSAHEPSRRVSSPIRIPQKNSSESHDSSESYEARIRGPRQRQSVNEGSIQ